MEKIFEFGKVDYENNGRKENLISVEIELKTNEKGEKVFSASGSIWNGTETDIICGGQCLDEIKNFLQDKNETFNIIYDMWKKYHLNDMHSECEHQRKLGWNEIAKEQVKIYKYTLNGETCRKLSDIKDNIMQRIKNGETVKANEDEIKMLNLEYFYNTSEELTEELKGFYELRETEIKTKGWLNEKEHKDGLLGKKCPICNYAYGSAWKTLIIPEDDLKTIEKLFEIKD